MEKKLHGWIRSDQNFSGGLDPGNLSPDPQPWLQAWQQNTKVILMFRKHMFYKEFKPMKC